MMTWQMICHKDIEFGLPERLLKTFISCLFRFSTHRELSGGRLSSRGNCASGKGYWLQLLAAALFLEITVMHQQTAD